MEGDRKISYKKPKTLNVFKGLNQIATPANVLKDLNDENSKNQIEDFEDEENLNY